MTAWSIVLLLFVGGTSVALGAYAGHRFTLKRSRQQILDANDDAARMIDEWHRNVMLAGAYALSLSPDRVPASLEGLENCYYSPPDFEQVTWVGKDMPAPFVGAAPIPGKLPGCIVNGMQFRYARELEVPKPPNLVRIFFTGGSVAYGIAATSNDTTIGGYLEKHLNAALVERGVRCEVITAAACSWTSTHERILIENRLIELEPDIVISFAGHNDAFWSVSGRNVFWFRGFQDDYFFSLANLMLASKLAEQFPRDVAGIGPPVNAVQAAVRLARNVAFSHHALTMYGAQYVWVLQPVMEVGKKPRTAREQRVAAAVCHNDWFIQMESYYQEIRNTLRALALPGFHFVDASTIFDDCSDMVDAYVDTCHFGDRGNDLIARGLCRDVLPIINARLMPARVP